MSEKEYGAVLPLGRKFSQAARTLRDSTEGREERIEDDDENEDDDDGKRDFIWISLRG